MEKARSWVTPIVLIVIAIELMVIVSVLVGDVDGKGNIAIVKVDGQIEKSNEIVAGIKKYRMDDKVKAIVVRIDTPGGAVGASQEIHDEIITAKKKKPVVCSFGNISASGGYYIGVACDQIVSTPGTITGSIGVITQFFRVDEVLKKFHLHWEVVKSGKNKDIGSPLKELEPEQRRLMQSMIDDIYDQFVEAVAAGRKMDKEKVKILADGRVYTGRQAKELGLVDVMGGLQKAVELAAQQAKIEEKDVETFVFPRERVSFMDSVAGGAKSMLQETFSVQYLMQ